MPFYFIYSTFWLGYEVYRQIIPRNHHEKRIGS